MNKDPPGTVYWGYINGEYLGIDRGQLEGLGIQNKAMPTTPQVIEADKLHNLST